MESLEARCFLSAGQLDTSFGAGGHLVDDDGTVPITPKDNGAFTVGFPCVPGTAGR